MEKYLILIHGVADLNRKKIKFIGKPHEELKKII